MERQSYRRKVLAECRRVVVKIGSAVLTGEHGLDLRVVNRLADQIAVLHDKGKDVVLVTSGAVAAGRKVVKGLKHAQPFHGLPSAQATSAIGQSRLMHEYDEAFGRYGKVTAQILLTKDDFRDRQRFLNAKNTFNTLLSWRVIPVVNENDTVAVAELKFGDNDSLASMLISLMEADLFVNLTSAAGVFEENPEENPHARCVPYIDAIGGLDVEHMCQGKTPAGSGGMYSKLLAARRAAQLGVPSLIVSGRDSFALEKAFSGEELGTWVMPERQKISRRKFWLAYHDRPVGEVWIDQGAKSALEEKHKSLLPVGIVRVVGEFGFGELVRILDFQGQTVGVGLSNYSAEELRTIMGRQSDKIEQLLGKCLYPEAMHRDNILLDPAL